MAGTTKTVTRAHSIVDGDELFELYREHNNVITDLATLRDGGLLVARYVVEDLAANADITARPVDSYPFAFKVTSVKVIPVANSAGVAASPNDLVLTLRNITAGNDIATVTLTANLVAATPVTVTLTANVNLAANDVIGITVTQGTAADTAGLVFVMTGSPATLDAAGDLVAAALSTAEAGD